MTKYDEITLEEVEYVYQTVGFDVSKELNEKHDKSIESILKLGASELIVDERNKYEDELDELMQNVIYAGVDRRMHTPYVVSRDKAKIQAVIWVVSCALSVSSQTGLGANVETCAKNLLGECLPIVQKLNDQEKCVFFRIYYLYEAHGRRRGVSEEEIESFALGIDKVPHCFISSQIKCSKRNREDNTLCGQNFEVFPVIEKLLTDKIIKKENDMIVPNSFFI